MEEIDVLLSKLVKNKKVFDSHYLVVDDGIKYGGIHFRDNERKTGVERFKQYLMNIERS